MINLIQVKASKLIQPCLITLIPILRTRNVNVANIMNKLVPGRSIKLPKMLRTRNFTWNEFAFTICSRNFTSHTTTTLFNFDEYSLSCIGSYNLRGIQGFISVHIFVFHGESSGLTVVSKLITGPIFLAMSMMLIEHFHLNVVKPSAFLLFLAANDSHKGSIEVGGVLAWLVLSGKMDFILLISFIESSSARQKRSPLFSSDSIYIHMLPTIIYWFLASGGISVAVK